jgi:hypothetical protein
MIPRIATKSENTTTINPTIVPNPAKGTPIKIQIKLKIMTDKIEMKLRINPKVDISDKGLFDTANIPRSENLIKGKYLALLFPVSRSGRIISTNVLE